MYDGNLANRILEILDAAFPRKLPFDAVRAAAPNFASLSEEMWLFTVYGLVKEGFVEAFVRCGQGDVPEFIANMEITEAGRQVVRESGVRLDENRGALDDTLPLLARRQFDSDFPALSGNANESAPISLVMIDLDHFKSINDNFGHSVGDEVLLKLASAIKSICSGKGRCYRWGGDELAILLPNHSRQEAEAVALRVRNVCSALAFPNYPRKITLSIGVACYPGSCDAGAELFHCADQALYAAKNGGRDQVAVANSLHP